MNTHNMFSCRNIVLREPVLNNNMQFDLLNHFCFHYRKKKTGRIKSMCSKMYIKISLAKEVQPLGR